MERREFLNTVAAASTCAMASSMAVAGETGPDADAQNPAPTAKKYALKITVLKRGFEKDLVDNLKTGPKGPCTRFSDGQEFKVTSQWAMPEKFCEWAYADIRAYIPMVLGQGNPIAVCCTDGFRPVFFKIERVDA
jgi:uncharacterized repeat protein (TIGR04076 family)